MNRPGVVRRFRRVISAACVTACVLVVVLWMRTIARADVLWGPTSRNSSLVIVSAPGYMEFAISRELVKRSAPWGLATHTAEPNSIRRILNLNFGAFRFRRDWNGSGLSVTAPHWFVVLLAATFAVLPLINWHWRFTLRTMFATVAIVAFVLWLIVEIRG